MRHAQTYLNLYERMQGWANAPLTPKGIADCHASGRGLKNIKFDAVYTSDLQRTIDTANIILSENLQSQNVSIVPMSEFREVFFGSFEGLPVFDIWPNIVKSIGSEDVSKQQLINRLHEIEPTKDAENYMAFWTRIEKGLMYLLKTYKHTDKNVLIVSHGLAINIMLSGIIANYDFKGHLDNASVTKVTYRNGQFELECINQIDHFIYEA